MLEGGRCVAMVHCEVITPEIGMDVGALLNQLRAGAEAIAA